MPRAVVLHAGFHKTGTSTIQAFLRRNRKRLMPHLAIRLKGQMNTTLQGARGFSTWRDPISLDKTRRRFGKLLDELPGMPRRVLCLSAEELVGHMPGRGDLTDYGAAITLLPLYHSEISARFPESPVTVYLGTRTPEAWLRSAWGEHVKSSSLTLDYDAFATTYRNGAELDAMVDQIADKFPGTVVSDRLDNTARMPLGPVTPLLDLCDIPPGLQQSMTAEPAQNTAIAPEVMAALLEINRTYQDPEARSKAKAEVLAAGHPT